MIKKEVMVFNDLITGFLQREKIGTEDNVMLFFQGFSAPCFEALKESKIKHFSDLADCTQLFNQQVTGKDLLGHFISSSRLCWGYYEELIALAEILNNFSVYNGKIMVVKNNLFSDYYPIRFAGVKAEIINCFESELIKNLDEPILNYYADCKSVDGELFFSYINKHFEIDAGIKIGEVNFYDLQDSNRKKKPEIKSKMNITRDQLPIYANQIQLGQLSDILIQIIGDEKNFTRELDAVKVLAGYYNVLLTVEKETNFDNQGEKYLPLLKRFWGDNACFYDQIFYKDPAISRETYEISQGALIADIILQSETASKNESAEYSDIIVTAPTGAGKSLLFQIPGIQLHQQNHALTIVICPLVALMADQVKEMEERGINYATYINSSITFEERQKRLNGIKTGQYSIVYLSPELLLAYDIQSLVGERRIGLMVIDEAHLVTSWGRDFRVDYWFLGDYIEKLRRGCTSSCGSSSMRFPVLCLTATAVFGGKDDVIGDLQNSLRLHCYTEHLYIGYVRRNNIRFKIRHPRRLQSDKEEKLELTTKSVCQFVKNKEKSIVYYPFVTQIEDTNNQLKSNHQEIHSQVEKYYGGMRSEDKTAAYNQFRENESLVMMATKAFGMGVNIPDVKNVYHYAPTGTLADYVQEIGRAARKLDEGYAITDYLYTDMKYARTLWGLSGLRHYQIREIIKKLYSLYQGNGCKRNLLFSPDTFSYLFDTQSVDLKVKSGLMLLSSDLLEKYHFKVITVRPKNLFTTQYIIVPQEIENAFLGAFGEYCKKMTDDKPRVILAHGRNEEVLVTKNGNVYEIQLGDLWENKFENYTFAQFKYEFFSGKLFSFGESHVAPNMKLVITYESGYDNVCQKFQKLAKALQITFNRIYSKFNNRHFLLKDFTEIFTQQYGIKVKKEYLTMLLDVFCYERTDLFEIPVEQWKFIERPKTDNDEKPYCIRTQKHGFIENSLKRYIKEAAPNNSNDKFITYLSIPKKDQKYSSYQLVAYLLELFDMGSFELIGGRNPQIFVRINDPLKLKRIVESEERYSNTILRQIEERHKRAIIIMNKFMEADLDDETRWSIIEDYFLGLDENIETKLGIAESTVKKFSEKGSAKKRKEALKQSFQSV
ncbi:DEAD/DEAH box helicase [Acetobacterium malicum]|uniref:DEAD/DEAH box helicase n=1 Tax=Acetobacterium malicum TaxID=52692 RepID=UPI00164A304B|nr:DEAD/DEAH box helicase [Acetobacterium malicum]